MAGNAPTTTSRSAALVQTTLRAAMTYAQATATTAPHSENVQARSASTTRAHMSMLLHTHSNTTVASERARAREHGAQQAADTTHSLPAKEHDTA